MIRCTLYNLTKNNKMEQNWALRDVQLYLFHTESILICQIPNTSRGQTSRLFVTGVIRVARRGPVKQRAAAPREQRAGS